MGSPATQASFTTSRENSVATRASGHRRSAGDGTRAPGWPEGRGVDKDGYVWSAIAGLPAQQRHGSPASKGDRGERARDYVQPPAPGVAAFRKIVRRSPTAGELGRGVSGGWRPGDPAGPTRSR